MLLAEVLCVGQRRSLVRWCWWPWWVVGRRTPGGPDEQPPAWRVSSGRGRSRRLVDQPSPQRAVRCRPADVSVGSGLGMPSWTGRCTANPWWSGTRWSRPRRTTPCMPCPPSMGTGGVVGVVGSADARCGRLDWPSSYPT